MTTKRCDRNRKRSRRRAIYCPVHGCHLDSVSQKHPLFASKPEHLQQRGMGRKQALMLVADREAIALSGEWLEAFWCDGCQESRWYHVCKQGEANQYRVTLAPEGLWRQATGVIHPQGNPTVGEFTRRQARATRFEGVRDFGRLG